MPSRGNNWGETFTKCQNMFCKNMNISKLFWSAVGLFPHLRTCIIAVKKVEANDRNIFLIPLNADHRLGSASHGQLKTYKCDTPCNKDGVLFLIWPILSFQKIKKEKTKIWFIWWLPLQVKNDNSHFFFFFSCDINMWQPLITEMQLSWKKSLNNQFDVKHFHIRV